MEIQKNAPPLVNAQRRLIIALPILNKQESSITISLLLAMRTLVPLLPLMLQMQQFLIKSEQTRVNTELHMVSPKTEELSTLCTILEV